MIVQAIRRVLQGKDLTEREAKAVMDEIMTGRATPAQIAGWLVALKMKGETVSELVGCARVMRELVRAPRLDGRDLVDTCGTGGDGARTFNISTVSALVAAGAGARIAKHGNRAVSSRCGSADVLKALGVNIEAPARVVERCVTRVGVGFLFAPLFHTAMKYAAAPRRELGVRTLFNLLGPLTNPFGARHQLVGVYEERLVPLVAQALLALGSRHAIVCHGEDGLDEVTTTGRTRIAEVAGGKISRFTLTPRDAGLRQVPLSALTGGSCDRNARIALGILKGRKGPPRDIVVLNAGCALYAGDRVRTIREGVSAAQEAIDSGRALEKLTLLKQESMGGRR
ncbi:MAG: anthranilate phosphoribosyltransferase [Candidatus Omnitrophica bacterium]|nr:anthranilate phosphoribosyltransferase [Candidatus Omnitrophota bacterium]